MAFELTRSGEGTPLAQFEIASKLEEYASVIAGAASGVRHVDETEQGDVVARHMDIAVERMSLISASSFSGLARGNVLGPDQQTIGNDQNPEVLIHIKDKPRTVIKWSPLNPYAVKDSNVSGSGKITAVEFGDGTLRVREPGAAMTQYAKCAILATLGLTDKEVADVLFIAKDTEKTHLKRVFKSTKATSRSELGFILIQDGYLVPESATSAPWRNNKERHVSQHVARGLANAAIAKSMDTSEDRIKTSIRAIFKRNDFTMRTQLAMATLLHDPYLAIPKEPVDDSEDEPTTQTLDTTIDQAIKDIQKIITVVNSLEIRGSGLRPDTVHHLGIAAWNLYMARVEAQKEPTISECPSHPSTPVQTATSPVQELTLAKPTNGLTFYDQNVLDTVRSNIGSEVWFGRADEKLAATGLIKDQLSYQLKRLVTKGFLEAVGTTNARKYRLIG